MNITKKFLAMEFIMLPILIVAGFFGAGEITFVLLLLITFAVLVTDYIITPGKAFEVSRTGENILSLKAVEKMQFDIKSLVDYSSSVEITDELPSFHFRRLQDVVASKFKAYEGKIIHYDIESRKRGIYRFGNLHLRYTSRLGFLKKQMVFAIAREYKVYPNVVDLKKYRLVVQKSLKLSQGDKVVKIKGLGMEFESLKEYGEDDDYRKINWNASARAGKPIVNQYEIEKNQPVFILLDSGHPMSYSLKGYKKLDYAINAGLILADIVNQKGDQAGLMVFDTDVRTFIPAGKGAAHRNAFVEALYRIEEKKTVSDYEGAFITLSRKQSRRSLVFIFTDFGVESEAIEMIKSMSILSKRHVPVVVVMKNEALENIAENESDIYVRAAAKEHLMERNKIIRALNTRGILCIESPENMLAINAVNRYLLLKNKNIL